MDETLQEMKERNPDKFNLIAKLLDVDPNNFKSFQTFIKPLSNHHFTTAKEFLYFWGATGEDTIEKFLEITLKLERGDIIREMHKI